MRDNGRVTQLTEPQVWVLIGVFSAAFFGLIGVVTTSLNRTMNARFEGINSRFEGMNSRFETMDARFQSMEARVDAKFDIINVKLENMDRDIQALSRHVFGTDPRS
jgi:flagellar capping protein FliD